MIHPKTFLTLAAIATFPAFIIFSKEGWSHQKNGAAINIESKADGFWTQQTNSGWTLEKVSETKNLQLRINDFYSVSYALNVVKEQASQSETRGATGEVCIKNSGNQATANLKIENQVQYRTKGGFKDVADANQTSNSTQIDAGKKDCVPFKIAFTPAQDATQFRVKTKATISNFFKKQGEEKPTSDTDNFKLPITPQSNQETATITDSITCPQNYTCTPTDTGPWNTSSATTINYSVAIKNVSAPCTLPVSLKNTATLTENTTQNNVSSTSEIPINTGPC